MNSPTLPTGKTSFIDLYILSRTWLWGDDHKSLTISGENFLDNGNFLKDWSQDTSLFTNDKQMLSFY
ncbi:MAG: hypothetical protein ABJA70_15340 [Chryseolinea sp.]